MFFDLLKSTLTIGGMVLKEFQGKVQRNTKASDLDDQYVQKSSIAHTILDDLIQEMILELLVHNETKFDINMEEITPRINYFEDANEDLTFHLDPLDGTFAFTENRNDYAIGAGISKGTKFLESAIYLPAQDRIYYGTHTGEFKLVNSYGIPLDFERQDPPGKFFVQKRCEDRLEYLANNNFNQYDSMSAHYTMMQLVEGEISVSLYQKAAVHDFGIPKIILEAVGGVCTDENADPIKIPENYNRMDYFFAFANENLKNEFFKG